MEILYYDAEILPEITLLGKDESSRPHRNVRRVSEDYIFYFVLQGTLSFREDEREVTLTKGDTYLFEPGLLHYGTADSCYNLFYLHFRHPRTSEKPDAIPGAVPIAKQMHFCDGMNFEKLCFLFEQILEQHDRRLEHTSVLTACAASAFFAEAAQRNRFQPDRFRTESRTAARVGEVISYLNRNYGSPISGEQLEKELSYNFDYLNQLFRRHLGTTIFRMLESIRVEKASNLLLTDNRPVTQVAQEVGFREEKYFSKVFKKNVGVSPTAYRSRTQTPD